MVLQIFVQMMNYFLWGYSLLALQNNVRICHHFMCQLINLSAVFVFVVMQHDRVIPRKTWVTNCGARQPTSADVMAPDNTGEYYLWNVKQQSLTTNVNLLLERSYLCSYCCHAIVLYLRLPLFLGQTPTNCLQRSNLSCQPFPS